MAVVAKGINVRQTSGQILIDAFLQDISGALVTTGTTTVKVYEVESDGTLSSYDFNSNTFKTTALTTETLALTHQKGNNNTTNTGYWTGTISTLTGFTSGGIYLALVNNTGATPTDQMTKFQFGGAEGDLAVTASGTTSYLQDDLRQIAGSTTAGTNLSNAYASFETGTAQAGSSTSITLRSGASASDSFYNSQVVYIMSGTGSGQTNKITSYVGSTKVATVETTWVTNPTSSSVYIILGRVG